MGETLAIVKNSRLALLLFPVVNEFDRAPMSNMELIAFAKHSVQQACGAQQADVAAVQALIPDFPVVAVLVDPTGAAHETFDLRLSEKESAAEAVAKVTALLKERQITA